MPRVAIVGAGVTGLTAAFLLARNNVEVAVFEKRDRPGGAVRTIRRDGFIAETGPNTLLINNPEVEALISEFGLNERIVPTAPSARKRFIARASAPVPVPMSPGGFIKTPLFSGRAKLRLLREPFIRRRPANLEDESLADFTVRRLGREVLDYAVNPFVAGVYAGDPRQLSVRHAFPKLWEMEAAGGSLFRGALALARRRKRAGTPRYRSKSITFDGGLQTMTEQLADALGPRLHLSSTIERLQPGSPWKLEISDEDGNRRQEVFDAVVLATPAKALPALPFSTPLTKEWNQLNEIAYPPVASVALGYRREDVGFPCDGFGVLIPESEPFRILGCLFNSSLFSGRAPSGHVLLTAFAGGTRAPEIAALPPAELEKIVREDLARLLGVRGEPVFKEQTVWRHAIPQYNLGYERYLQIMAEAETANTGLFIGGNVRDGIALGNCLLAGKRLATEASQFLKSVASA